MKPRPRPLPSAKTDCERYSAPMPKAKWRSFPKKASASCACRPVRPPLAPRDIRELLIASHILPWGKYPEERLNVRNGLCLSRLHDAAFDMGLIAFDDNLRLLLSPRLKDALPQKIVADTFGAYVGQPLILPADAIPPDPEFLRRHREAVDLKG